MFDSSNSDDDDVAEAAQDEIDTTLFLSLQSHEDGARENVDLFLDGPTAWWRPNSDRYILFYKQNEKPYGCFSNFHKGYPITIDGVIWPTVEHYYHAMKFPLNKDLQEEIRQVKWAGHAWKIGQSAPEGFDNDWWIGVRDEVMLKALRVKFEQHAEFREVLFKTKGIRLIEHTINDNYWADGGDGSGKNVLGKMLMQIRDDAFPDKHVDE